VKIAFLKGDSHVEAFREQWINEPVAENAVWEAA
jgi:hypothetical protein